MKATRNLRMRLLCIGLCLICMMQMVLPAAAAPAEEERAEIFYTSKVYFSASAKAFVIGHFENGTALNVLGESGAYYKVDCYDMIGYISKSQVVMENDGYYVNCDISSSDTQSITYTPLADALALRASVMEYAQEKLGCRYRHGTSGPKTFDCSGYTSYVYRQVGYELLRGSQAQLQDGVIVSMEGLQVGDLLFYKGTHNRSYVSHVAIYAGNGQMIHADSRGVIYTDLDDAYYASRFVCARRVINVSAAQAEDLVAPNAQNALSLVRTTTNLR